MQTRPANKLVVVGAGILGHMHMLYAYLDSVKQGYTLRGTMHDALDGIHQTTGSKVTPSITYTEFGCVVPAGNECEMAMQKPFDQAGGIYNDEINNIPLENDAFLITLKKYAQQPGLSQRQTKIILELGKESAALWDELFYNVDAELQSIMRAANYNPCRELNTNTEIFNLHDGYRLDLIFGMVDENGQGIAQAAADAMIAEFHSVGSKNSQTLTPEQVVKIDPSLTNFCLQHSTDNKWHTDAHVIKRPGGCINLEVFLPLLQDYLVRKMGQYVNDKGQRKNCLQIHYQHKVNQVNIEDSKITGLGFFNGSATKKNAEYQTTKYMFTTGPSMALPGLGFDTIASRRFPGVSLKLCFTLDQPLLKHYSKLNNCMELHAPGVVLAWQAKVTDEKLYLKVAGTKCYIGSEDELELSIDGKFALNRNLVQLNMINQVYPELISHAFFVATGNKRDTKGQKLSENDLRLLEQKQLIKRDIGYRAVAADSFFTIGQLTHNGQVITNGRVNKDAGSGGVSFAPVLIKLGNENFDKASDLHKEALQLARPNRRY